VNEQSESPDQEDLKATADSIRRDAERLAQLEKQKSELDVEDPRVDQISADIEQLISQIADKGKAERELAADEGDDDVEPSRQN
jgi:hypothetical protein